MTELSYVCLYNSYLGSLAGFTDAQVGRLVRAMLAYSQNGELPQFKGTERLIWPTLQGQIDRDKESYADRRRASIKNGAKGGRPKSQKNTQELISETQETQGFISETQKTQGFFSKPKKPKEKENKKEKEKENEKEMDKESERENITAGAADHPPSLCMTPPSAKEVQLYCLQASLDLDPQRFVDYYASIGWKRGNHPITDWRAAARYWASMENPEKAWDL